jgi:hypothetical protein
MFEIKRYLILHLTILYWSVIRVYIDAGYTGRFIIFSVITNTYNKKTKGPTLMELFTATGKLKKVFLQLVMFDVCTTGDTAHIDKIFKFLPHTRQHGCIGILHCLNDPLGTDYCNSEENCCTHVDACVPRTWISYRCVPFHPGTHIEHH